MTTSSTTMSRSELDASLQVVELKPGLRFTKQMLKDLLPDVETALFFAKVYMLDAQQVGTLLHTVFNSRLTAELFTGSHSTELQYYIIGGYDEDTGIHYPGIVGPHQAGEVVFDPEVPKGEILPEVWKNLEVEVAKSIAQVAAKLSDVVARMPGKQGAMVFNSMRVMNRKRPTIGDYRAKIHHERQKSNLLILDVSGSMTQPTIEAIIEDVVALSYMANADMAIVSNTTAYWSAGTYDVEAVLSRAEFGGTHYETLHELMNMDWGTVITVADYDSSMSSFEHLRDHCKGHIDEVLDISLVNRPTFLAQCVGQFADKVSPLLMGSSQRVLQA